MSNKKLILYLVDHADLRLRMIDKQDVENLRTWKNNNKNSFFLNKDITSEQQEKWYEGFATRQEDHMFIVEQKVNEEWTPIGCMGYRKLEDEGCVDAYNIIRSRKIEPASFTMSEAFGTMLAYAGSIYPDLPIRCKVLSHNPAVEWYKKNEFSILREEYGYYLMEVNKEALKNFDWYI